MLLYWLIICGGHDVDETHYLSILSQQVLWLASFATKVLVNGLMWLLMPLFFPFLPFLFFLSSFPFLPFLPFPFLPLSLLFLSFFFSPLSSNFLPPTSPPTNQSYLEKGYCSEVVAFSTMAWHCDATYGSCTMGIVTKSISWVTPFHLIPPFNIPSTLF